MQGADVLDAANAAGVFVSGYVAMSYGRWWVMSRAALARITMGDLPAAVGLASLAWLIQGAYYAATAPDEREMWARIVVNGLIVVGTVCLLVPRWRTLGWTVRQSRLGAVAAVFVALALGGLGAMVM